MILVRHWPLKFGSSSRRWENFETNAEHCNCEQFSYQNLTMACTHTLCFSEIAELMAVKSKHGAGGEYSPDWKPKVCPARIDLSYPLSTSAGTSGARSTSTSSRRTCTAATCETGLENSTSEDGYSQESSPEVTAGCTSGPSRGSKTHTLLVDLETLVTANV